MNKRQEAFDYVWRAKQADGFRKTTAWKEGGAPFSGNGCNCLAMELTASGHWFAFEREERVALIGVHSRALSAAEMEAGLRAWGLRCGLTVPDDPFKRFMEKVHEPVSLEAAKA